MSPSSERDPKQLRRESRVHAIEHARVLVAPGQAPLLCPATALPSVAAVAHLRPRGGATPALFGPSEVPSYCVVRVAKKDQWTVSPPGAVGNVAGIGP